MKMPQGANTNTIKWNGTKPNQNFENILPKIIVPTPFSKIPNSRNLKQILHNLSKKMKRILKNIPLS